MYAGSHALVCLAARASMLINRYGQLVLSQDPFFTLHLACCVCSILARSDINVLLLPALSAPRLRKTLLLPNVRIMPCFEEPHTVQKLLDGDGVIYVRCSHMVTCQLPDHMACSLQIQTLGQETRIEMDCTVIGFAAIARDSPMAGLYHMLGARQRQRLEANFDRNKAVLDMSDFDILWVSRIELEKLSLPPESSVDNFREHLRALVDAAESDPSLWYIHVAQDTPGQPPTELKAPFNILPLSPTSGHKKAKSNEEQLKKRKEWFDRTFWKHGPLPGTRERTAKVIRPRIDYA